MAATFQVDIVSAEREIWSGTAGAVFANAEMGEVGIYPRHAPLLTRLNPGEVRVQLEDGSEEDFFISGGLLEVQGHIVTVLSDTAVRAEDLDEAAAIEAQKKAEQAMKDQQSEMDYAKAKAELVEAAARIQTIQKLRKRRK